MPRILHDEVPQMHWHGVNLPKIREIEALRRMTFLFGATIHGFDHMVTRVVLSMEVLVWRERWSGCGFPGGLPLNFRFSRHADGQSARSPVSSTMIWRPSSSSPCFNQSTRAMRYFPFGAYFAAFHLLIVLGSIQPVCLLLAEWIIFTTQSACAQGFD